MNQKLKLPICNKYDYYKILLEAQELILQFLLMGCIKSFYSSQLVGRQVENINIVYAAQ